ncbi:8-oxo-dGTP diphosphatase MutT [uncultured Cocleimonas sp.]|uniref:8-oxo-dGTP diphosphatase MutT n=1 Tax=uncultured Cocleimonas sp. TaxID=1051587 RepID=UPI00262AB780|nr:8-oxo-dGTP diphosphatase MutT [uncultured Cocleimonas sp.]
MIIRVAVAVIINQNKEILIAKRSQDQHQGNKWEFPGGKVEANETSEDALRREILEELGIQVQSSSEMTSITHEYIEENPENNKTVILDVFDVRKWQGEPKGVEGQPIRWITVEEIDNYEFPIANVEIVNIIKCI